ncbi:MAG: tetratricopeptide repeat protein, partial [Anaerolineae bacterium]|nr:tetratricopeptide repeat protein [Anaerolineae bacterium]
MLAGAPELDLDERAAARVLRSWGYYHTQGGELDAALDYLERGRALVEKSGDQSGVSGALHNMANIHAVRGDLEQARRLYQQSLEIVEAL